MWMGYFITNRPSTQWRLTFKIKKLNCGLDYCGYSLHAPSILPEVIQMCENKMTAR